MPTAHLHDRALISIDGPEAEHFLQNIVTTDLDALGNGEAKPGALLTPQGKILFDFLVSRGSDGGLRLECRADIADDFIRRLTMYRLRAKVEITKQEQSLVAIRWDLESTASQIDSSWLADRRFPLEAKVMRSYVEVPPPLTPPLQGEGITVVAVSPSPLRAGVRGGGEQPLKSTRFADAGAPNVTATPEDWHHLRIAHGIAESGSDYELGDAFPHDTLLDETGGVGFRKGCYVGQEVVSRMQHRGTARRRVMIARGDADLPAAGTEVRANDRPIGVIGSSAGREGLAIMRIDRVKDALDAGHAITADGVSLALSIPAWARYTLPQDADPAEQT